MSWKKMCRTLACCKRPSTNTNVAPDAIPGQAVVRVEVAPAPAPAPIPKTDPGHRYTSTVDDVRDLLRTTPPMR